MIYAKNLGWTLTRTYVLTTLIFAAEFTASLHRIASAREKGTDMIELLRDAKHLDAQQPFECNGLIDNEYLDCVRQILEYLFDYMEEYGDSNEEMLRETVANHIARVVFNDDYNLSRWLYYQPHLREALWVGKSGKTSPDSWSLEWTMDKNHKDFFKEMHKKIIETLYCSGVEITSAQFHGWLQRETAKVGNVENVDVSQDKLLVVLWNFCWDPKIAEVTTHDNLVVFHHFTQDLKPKYKNFFAQVVMNERVNDADKFTCLVRM